MFWRVLVALLKPVVLVALFGFLGRLADVTGMQLSIVQPAAEAISKVTGLPENMSAALAIGAVAVGSLKVLAAIGRVATAGSARN